MKKQNNPGAIVALAAAIREQANTLILSSLSERGITDILPAHGAVLNALFKQSPMQMNELAEHIGRKKNTVTGLIATLEDRGYCRRESDPQDARAQLVFLSEKGEAMRQVQDEVSVELLQKIWTGIETQKQIECIQCLETILQNLTNN
ncbi:MAG: MarR family transcriptional regulator [Desulfovibrio sp. MES5]|uniref:MarR family winged helix-turn-helix transcriptional regulator n=1 Tax=Desulfovibrio sp. MES5 TaxID=1899016 RepID=UPI000B9C8259|nr:MarR family transcriptional regulator [Desulfovibrio sp. MES5]OXS28470.1 MAG: MarR family transcriptional regulator [Desulfovibrio sp. MES5]